MVLGRTIFLIERDKLILPTKVTGPVKVDHLQRWSLIFRLDCTKMVCSFLFLTKVSGILGSHMESPHRLIVMVTT